MSDGARFLMVVFDILSGPGALWVLRFLIFCDISWMDIA